MRSEAHRAVALIGVVALCQNADGRRIGLEQDGQSGGAAYLEVFPGGEALVQGRVHPLVGIGGRHDFADQVQLGCLGIDKAGLVRRPLGKNRQGATQKEHRQKESFSHDLYYFYFEDGFPEGAAADGGGVGDVRGKGDGLTGNAADNLDDLVGVELDILDRIVRPYGFLAGAAGLDAIRFASGQRHLDVDVGIMGFEFRGGSLLERSVHDVDIQILTVQDVFSRREGGKVLGRNEREGFPVPGVLC